MAVLSPVWLLTIYCALVLLASLAGGWVLLVIRPTHTRLQLATSFVAGLMLGIALLHFLPLPQGQGSLRPTFGPVRIGLALVCASVAAAASLTTSLGFAPPELAVVVPPNALVA